MLFFLILMRMTGFVFLNPVFGRKNIPAMLKSGLTLGLSIIVYSTAQAQGVTVDIDPGSSLIFGFSLMKEFAVGYLFGYVMILFDMVMTYAGTVIDFQIGISMAMVYDPQTGSQIALSGNILQIFYLLLFFAVDGHLALIKIVATSGDVVPYGAAAFTQGAAVMMLDIFVQCVVLAMKLAFPLIAFEFLMQVGVGILTKITPQINLFVLSIQLRLIVGFTLLLLLLSPIGDYIGNLITMMVDSLEDVLKVLAAG